MLFLLFGYCEILLLTFLYGFLCGHMFSFLWVIYLAVELLDHFFEKLPNCFPQWLHHFTFPWAVYEGSSFFTSLPMLVIVLLFDYSPTSVCELVSQGFHLHLSNDQWCWASFKALIPRVFKCKMWSFLCVPCLPLLNLKWNKRNIWKIRHYIQYGQRKVGILNISGVVFTFAFYLFLSLNFITF